MSMPLPPTISADLQLSQAPTSGAELSSCVCAEGHNTLNFKDIMAEASCFPDIIAQLKQILTEEQLADLKDALKDGNGLPLSAIFSLDSDLTPELTAEIEELTQILAQIPQQLQDAVKNEGQFASSLIESARKLSEGIGKLGKELPRGVENFGQQIKDALAPVLEQAPSLANKGQELITAIKGEMPLVDVALKAPILSQPVTEAVTQTTPNVTTPLNGLAQINSLQQNSGTAQTLPAPVTVPLNDKGWSESMGERIMWMVGKGLQAASVRINPPNLGPVHVQLSMQNDQASVNLVAQHGVVKEALEAAVPRLREMLAESNLQLVNVDVSHRESMAKNGSSELAEHGGRHDESSHTDDATHVAEAEEQVVHYASSRLLDFYA